ncbi:hypothetical protein MBCUT_01090 [Methanobrevibacter cuticularis]|uniref:Uncharacterized protein n=1 Tax=Methanobrevibacter cuticularis TaxID=47311 RepID=A0A166FIR6_9EURY|nr:hypothetical protein MBCUT_01090 [Methanobrevibacter cuticularis]
MILPFELFRISIAPPLLTAELLVKLELVTLILFPQKPNAPALSAALLLVKSQLLIVLFEPPIEIAPPPFSA